MGQPVLGLHTTKVQKREGGEGKTDRILGNTGAAGCDYSSEAGNTNTAYPNVTAGTGAEQGLRHLHASSMVIHRLAVSRMYSNESGEQV